MPDFARALGLCQGRSNYVVRESKTQFGSFLCVSVTINTSRRGLSFQFNARFLTVRFESISAIYLQSGSSYYGVRFK